MKERFRANGGEFSALENALVEPDAVYRLKGADISWARSHSFDLGIWGVSKPDAFTSIRLVLNMFSISKRIEYTDVYKYDFRLYDINAVYMMVRPEGVVGICDRRVFCHENYRLKDEREVLIETKPYTSVRTCGNALLAEVRKHLDEMTYRACAILT